MTEFQELRISLGRINRLKGDIRHRWNQIKEHFYPSLSSEEIWGSYFLRNYGETFNQILTLTSLIKDFNFETFNSQLTNIRNNHALANANLSKVIDLLQAEKIRDPLIISEIKNLFDLVYLVIEEKEEDKVFEDLMTYLSKKELLTIYKAVGSSSTELLFHAVKTEYVREILERGSIKGFTSHRFWDDGKRYKDNTPEYEDSYWMKGISMTRDIRYALDWGHVILVFDRREILKNHPIESYNWGNHLAGRSSTDHKKEREDFVVLSKNKKRYQNRDNAEWMKEYEEAMKLIPNEDYSAEEIKSYQDSLTKKIKSINRKEISKPEGEMFFSDSFKGVIVRGSLIDIYGVDIDLVQFLLNHPYFLGFLDKD